MGTCFCLALGLGLSGFVIAGIFAHAAADAAKHRRERRALLESEAIVQLIIECTVDAYA